MEVSIPTQLFLDTGVKKSARKLGRENIIQSYQEQREISNNGGDGVVWFILGDCGSDLLWVRRSKSTGGREQISLDPSSNLGLRPELFLFSQRNKTLEKRKKSVYKYTNISVFPTSCGIILGLLDKAKTQQEIIQLSALAPRTVRYALSKLLKEGVILQRANLLDARKSLYEVIK